MTQERVVGEAVAAAGTAGSWAIETFTSVKLSADAAIGLTAALTFVVQYIVPNKEIGSDDSQNSGA